MKDREFIIRSRTELDELLVNIETAVRVEKRTDFFSWLQGVFQSLIGHEVLVCAVYDPRSRSYQMEWMSGVPIEDSVFAAMCAPDGLVYRLIDMWEGLGREPLQLRPNALRIDARTLAEIERLRLDDILAHGLPDPQGRAATFFSFSRLTEGTQERHRDTLELVIPYLHAAWIRCWSGEEGGARDNRRLQSSTILTAREGEILSWVEQGKSNNEIARILNISHLTVKNHVQKILRKLNVQNRAQAVAKGISLQITSKWRGIDDAAAARPRSRI